MFTNKVVAREVPFTNMGQFGPGGNLIVKVVVFFRKAKEAAQPKWYHLQRLPKVLKKESNPCATLAG